MYNNVEFKYRVKEIRFPGGEYFPENSFRTVMNP